MYIIYFYRTYGKCSSDDKLIHTYCHVLLLPNGKFGTNMQSDGKPLEENIDYPSNGKSFEKNVEKSLWWLKFTPHWLRMGMGGGLRGVEN